MGRGSVGEEVTTGNRRCEGINAIEDWGRLRRGVNSGNQGGGVNSLTRHLEVEAGWRGVAERGEVRRRRGRDRPALGGRWS
jgi:hypothetical protein